MSRRYYITGVTGTGKTSVASKLMNNGFEVIDIDMVQGLCYWRNRKTHQITEYHTGVGGKWLSEHEYLLKEDIFKKLLHSYPKKDLIVVGIAANQETFFSLFDKVFVLYCRAETMIDRINSRNDGNNFGKDASEQEQLLTWHKKFHERMERNGAIPINTDTSLENVSENIQSHIYKKEK